MRSWVQNGRRGKHVRALDNAELTTAAPDNTSTARLDYCSEDNRSPLSVPSSRTRWYEQYSLNYLPRTCAASLSYPGTALRTGPFPRYLWNIREFKSLNTIIRHHERAWMKR